ncbi:lysophospholipase L1-like esterase [Motilibacter peucedani]|uniref:Lysophospholipase L1-like esterase n=1 Tax=Motilibacter peucedani TaxID=598650 RepID=A0A420XVI4_9ACTN|nr:GDSL-type esterase/lipase family protein [Motilibacter peucedani]RKS84306.1 lysophospholipase L1-like esterase [Motilibacter peucedani]
MHLGHRSLVTGLALASALLASACSSGSPAASPRPPATSAPASPAATAPATPSSKAAEGRPIVMAALGDSITQGFDACAPLSDCPEVSWATGSSADVRSLATRIGEARPVSGAYDDARSGALVADLPRQAQLAVSQRADAVTVLVGANDACRSSVGAMTPVSQFASAYGAALATISEGRPQARVFVASIPDLERLWRVGSTVPAAVQVWSGFPICPTMLADPTSVTAADQARRAAVRARVVAYNAVLRAGCAKTPHCRYDGGAVFAQPITAADLSSVDYFHPSVLGQARLAEVTWQRARTLWLP